MMEKQVNKIENTIHLGNCLQILEKLPQHSVDMILTDLPYGTTQNKWDSILPLNDLWNSIEKICKKKAVIAMTASQPFSSFLIMSNLKMFKHEWIWIKNRGSNFANTVREPMKEHESILIFSKGGWTYNKQMQERTGGGLDRVKGEFQFKTKTSCYGKFKGQKNRKLPELRIPSSWQKFNCEVGLHPTQKPISLFEYLIRTYTNDGDIVLDPCAGSGTTAIASLNMKRKYICIESDKKYFQLMKNRIKKWSGK